MNDLTKFLKVTVIKILSEFGEMVHKQNKNIKRDTEKIKNKILELNNTRAELRNSIAAFNKRLHQAEQGISQLDERSFERIQSRGVKRKKNEKE